VRALDDLQEALDGAKGELEIRVLRGTEERSVTAKLGS
jgi:hypothetical protein